jgi:hypothetical protein
VIDAIVVRPFGLGSCKRVSAWGPAECEVPFEEVVVEGRSGVVR